MEAEEEVLATSVFAIRSDGAQEPFSVSPPRHQPKTDVIPPRQQDCPSDVPTVTPSLHDVPSTAASAHHPPQLPPPPSQVKNHPFFTYVNGDTLARQKAMFIPVAEPQDTSYFMSRYIWNSEDETIEGSSDFDGMSDCSISSRWFIKQLGDECGSLADLSNSGLTVKYSFSNFSFKNLSQWASINHDLVVKNKDDNEAQKS